MLKNIKIRTILLSLVSLMTAFMLALAIIVTSTFNKLDSKMSNGLQNSQSYIILVDKARNVQVIFKEQVQEWKDILLRGQDPKAYKTYLDGFNAYETNVQAELIELEKLMKEQGINVDLVDDALNTHKDLGEKYKNALASFDAKDVNSYKNIDKMVKGIDRAPTDAIDNIVKVLQQTATKKMSDVKANITNEKKSFQKLLYSVVAVGIIIVAILVFLAFYVYANMQKSINNLRVLMSKAENGDLTVKGENYSKDEVGMMTEAFNNLITQIRKLMVDVKETSNSVENVSKQVKQVSSHVKITSEQISVAVEDIANGSVEQSELAYKGNNMLADVNKGIEEAASSMKDSETLTLETKEIVEDGVKIVNHQRIKMNENLRAVHGVNQAITKLSQHSNEIGQIVETISKIAQQTNLLALNAAIEAARAGEHGRGFAIVSDEVRKLAEQSEGASSKIASLINEIRSSIDNTVVEMNNTEKVVKEQELVVEELDNKFKGIISAVSNVTNEISKNAQNLNELSRSAVNVGDNIENIVSIVEESTANTEEVLASIEQQTASIEEMDNEVIKLYEYVNNLDKYIENFKI